MEDSPTLTRAIEAAKSNPGSQRKPLTGSPLAQRQASVGKLFGFDLKTYTPS